MKLTKNISPDVKYAMVGGALMLAVLLAVRLIFYIIAPGSKEPFVIPMAIIVAFPFFWSAIRKR